VNDGHENNDEVPPEWRERDAAARAERMREEAEVQRRRSEAVSKLKVASGIPELFLDIIEGSAFQATPATAEVERGSFKILVLAGKPGNGKTVAACRWLLDGLHAQRPPLFVTAARLSRWDRYDSSAMDRLLLASRLVLDDLGEEFNDTKGNFLAVLDETVCDRLSNKRATIVTTNLDVEQFTSRYGVRIRDRIRESGRWVGFAQPSMRGAPDAAIDNGPLLRPGAAHGRRGMA